jgi:hypothetical protein
MTEQHTFVVLLLTTDVLIGTFVAWRQYSQLNTLMFLVATTLIGYFGLMPLASYIVSGQIDFSIIKHVKDAFAKDPTDLLGVALLCVAVNYAVFRACRWMVWAYRKVTA